MAAAIIGRARDQKVSLGGTDSDRRGEIPCASHDSDSARSPGCCLTCRTSGNLRFPPRPLPTCRWVLHRQRPGRCISPALIFATLRFVLTRRLHCRSTAIHLWIAVAGGRRSERYSPAARSSNESAQHSRALAFESVPISRALGLVIFRHSATPSYSSRSRREGRRKTDFAFFVLRLVLSFAFQLDRGWPRHSARSPETV